MPDEGDVLAKQMEDMRKIIVTGADSRAKKFYEEFLIPAFAAFFSNPPYQRRGLALNRAILSIVAISYWEDMLRLKSYHPVNVPDKHKQAAHVFKWISRLRPIKPVTDHVEDMEEYLLQANAWYALACAQAHLGIQKFLKDEEQFIVYSSMYRDIHAREWSMIFYLLEQLHKDA